jgi:signal peptidase I
MSFAIVLLVSNPVQTPILAEDALPLVPRVNVQQRLGAAAMSALIPGLGQLRLGHSRKGYALLGGLIALLICFWPLRLPRFYAGLISILWGAVLLFNFAIFDALFSREHKTGHRLSLIWIPAGIIFVYIGLNIVFTACLVGAGFRTSRCMSSSMEPLLKVNDRFVFDSRYYPSHPKSRGDVVIVRREGSLIIKRIIAVGGDTIQGNDQEILLNGSAVNESYDVTQRDERSFGPVAVPAGKYFVMGDNREVSLDSRDYGPVEDAAIIGRTLYFYGFGPGPLTRRLD